jgi:hypothetical protein
MTGIDLSGPREEGGLDICTGTAAFAGAANAQGPGCVPRSVRILAHRRHAPTLAGGKTAW